MQIDQATIDKCQAKVSLPVKTWNAIIQKLGTFPYAEVADVIGQINSQCSAQVRQQLVEPKTGEAAEKPVMREVPKVPIPPKDATP